MIRMSCLLSMGRVSIMIRLSAAQIKSRQSLMPTPGASTEMGIRRIPSSSFEAFAMKGDPRCCKVSGSRTTRAKLTIAVISIRFRQHLWALGAISLIRGCRLIPVIRVCNLILRILLRVVVGMDWRGREMGVRNRWARERSVKSQQR